MPHFGRGDHRRAVAEQQHAHHDHRQEDGVVHAAFEPERDSRPGRYRPRSQHAAQQHRIRGRERGSEDRRRGRRNVEQTPSCDGDERGGDERTGSEHPQRESAPLPDLGHIQGDRVAEQHEGLTENREDAQRRRREPDVEDAQAPRSERPGEQRRDDDDDPDQGDRRDEMFRGSILGWVAAGKISLPYIGDMPAVARSERSTGGGSVRMNHRSFA